MERIEIRIDKDADIKIDKKNKTKLRKLCAQLRSNTQRCQQGNKNIRTKEKRGKRRKISLVYCIRDPDAKRNWQRSILSVPESGTFHFGEKRTTTNSQNHFEFVWFKFRDFVGGSLLSFVVVLRLFYDRDRLAAMSGSHRARITQRLSRKAPATKRRRNRPLVQLTTRPTSVSLVVHAKHRPGKMRKIVLGWDIQTNLLKYMDYYFRILNENSGEILYFAR